MMRILLSTTKMRAGGVGEAIVRFAVTLAAFAMQGTGGGAVSGASRCGCLIGGGIVGRCC